MIRCARGATPRTTGTRLLTAALAAAFLFTATAFAQTPIQRFPKIADMYRMLDPANPYRTVVSGLFRQTVKVGDVERPFLVYIAKDNAQYQPDLFVVPDARQDPVAVLEKGGWKKIAAAPTPRPPAPTRTAATT